MEMILCPRAHFKSVIVDGKIAYSGSANLTGAGLGAKGKDRRNFEGGILTVSGAVASELATSAGVIETAEFRFLDAVGLLDLKPVAAAITAALGAVAPG